MYCGDIFHYFIGSNNTCACGTMRRDGNSIMSWFDYYKSIEDKKIAECNAMMHL